MRGIKPWEVKAWGQISIAFGVSYTHIDGTFKILLMSWGLEGKKKQRKLYKKLTREFVECILE